MRNALLLACCLALTSSAQQASSVDLRPRIHFSPEKNWMNDPNGLVYFEGEYHLFFQYAPHSMTPAHISWGHAVSTDLQHWKELPVAIAAHDDELIFTGSVVVDEHNTSGLCLGGKACLVAVYTGHHGSGDTRREMQEISVSQDRGRTWQPYSGNPVLDLHMTDFRDPGVIWNEAAKQWTMVVALPDLHQVNFYSSPDLKSWTKAGSFGPAGATGGQWECPNLVKLSDSTWALKIGINPGGLQGGSGEQYFLGSFDGAHFTPSSEPGAHGWSDYGKDSYCALAFNHMPAGQKTTLIGWMDNWQYADRLPTFPFRGQMTLPRALSLLQDQAGIAMAQEPLTASLRLGHGAPVRLTPGASFVLNRVPSELQLTLQPKEGKVFGIRLYSDAEHFTEIGFDLNRQRMWMDRGHAGIQVTSDFPARTEAPISTQRSLDLHVVVDRTSVEAFAQNGSIAMTNLVFPVSGSLTVNAFAENGNDFRVTGQGWALKPTR